MSGNRDLDKVEDGDSFSLQDFLGETGHFDEPPSVLLRDECFRGVWIRNIPYETYDTSQEDERFIPFEVEQKLISFFSGDIENLVDIDYSCI